jgi:catechol 2,3-dioxygenase
MSNNKNKIKMPTSMKIGPPTLRVKNLQKELSFYETTLGLQTNQKYVTDDNLETVDLGFKGLSEAYTEPLLILKHDPYAKQTMNNFAGLYHFAILVPDRKNLAFAYSSIKNSNVNFDGFADHLVSESLYLHDPELNGIEIYSDKPQNKWQHDAKGYVIMDTLPLDLESLLSELNQDERKNNHFANGAKIGHMHLRVTNLERSVRFYQKLGLDITYDWSRMGASFLSAGGYHHHLGLNTWHSLGGKIHLKGEVGLDSFEIKVPDCSTIQILAHELKEHAQNVNSNQLSLVDPDGIRLIVKS